MRSYRVDLEDTSRLLETNLAHVELDRAPIATAPMAAVQENLKYIGYDTELISRSLHPLQRLYSCSYLSLFCSSITYDSIDDVLVP
jgi:hypothetical protein